MKCTRQRCQVALWTRVRATFNPLWSSEITSLPPRGRGRISVRSNSVQTVAASEQPTAIPSNSPPVVVDADHDGDRDGDNPSALAALYIRGVQPDIRPVAFQLRFRKVWTFSSISPHSRDA